jgi:hypothetical protein
MFYPSGMGEVTFSDTGNESASIIESDGRKIKENKLHSRKNRSACKRRRGDGRSRGRNGQTDNRREREREAAAYESV